MCAPRLPASISRLPAHSSPRTVCSPFDSRQYASAFNQPLSFDTSSVTNVQHMFNVRSSPHSLLSICSRALPRTLRAPPSPAICRLPPCKSPRIVCPPFDFWQQASAFNQPLSFDTSSVTNMQYMFQYARAFNQRLSFDTSSVTSMRRMFYVRPARAPSLAPHRMPSPFDSAGHSLLVRR